MRQAAIEAFYTVRDMPYAIDAAHDADGIVAVGAGDCLAKSELLARRFRSLGLKARLVRWCYELPGVVPEIELLPARADLHRAVEVHLGGRWRLVDATHDPGLAAVGWTVSDWDGAANTAGAWPTAGSRMVEGLDDVLIEAAIADIGRWVAACEPSSLLAWRLAFAQWIAEARRAAPLP